MLCSKYHLPFQIVWRKWHSTVLKVYVWYASPKNQDQVYRNIFICLLEVSCLQHTPILLFYPLRFIQNCPPCTADAVSYCILHQDKFNEELRMLRVEFVGGNSQIWDKGRPSDLARLPHQIWRLQGHLTCSYLWLALTSLFLCLWIDSLFSCYPQGFSFLSKRKNTIVNSILFTKLSQQALLSVLKTLWPIFVFSDSL